MRIQSIMPIKVKLNSFNNRNNYISKDDIADSYVPSCKNSSVFGSANLPDNFGEIVEGKLFRGSIPKTIEHFEALKEKGVKFILDLCGDNIDGEAKLAKSHGIGYCYENGDDLMFELSNDNYKRIMSLVDEKIKTGGVYVHDSKGESRTGIFTAYYQAKKGETPEKILEHAEKHGGYIPSIKSLLLCIKDGIL